MADHAAIADWSGERSGGALMPELSRMDEPEIERSEWIRMLAALDSKPGQAEVVELVDLTHRGYFQENRSLFAWGGLAAAALLIGAVLALSFMGPASTPGASPIATQEQSPTHARVLKSTQHVATLTATHEATWAGGAITRGAELRAGDRLTLTAGFAEVTTNRGAVAIPEAPATIELTKNDNAIRLHVGRLLGLCHTDSSKGFVVKTEHADITDLGTEFGVYAHANGVETTVFTGEVAVKTTNAPSQVLQHSQTARVSINDLDGTPALIIEDKLAEGFARSLLRKGLVAGAWINLATLQS